MPHWRSNCPTRNKSGRLEESPEPHQVVPIENKELEEEEISAAKAPEKLADVGPLMQQDDDDDVQDLPREGGSPIYQTSPVIAPNTVLPPEQTSSKMPVKFSDPVNVADRDPLASSSSSTITSRFPRTRRSAGDRRRFRISHNAETQNHAQTPAAPVEDPAGSSGSGPAEKVL